MDGKDVRRLFDVGANFEGVYGIQRDPKVDVPRVVSVDLEKMEKAILGRWRRPRIDE